MPGKHLGNPGFCIEPLPGHVILCSECGCYSWFIYRLPDVFTCPYCKLLQKGECLFE